jgi:hypothetical protein
VGGYERTDPSKIQKSGNLSGFLCIGNTKKRTYEKERLIGRRQNLDELLFKSEYLRKVEDVMGDDKMIRVSIMRE